LGAAVDAARQQFVPIAAEIVRPTFDAQRNDERGDESANGVRRVRASRRGIAGPSLIATVRGRSYPSRGGMMPESRRGAKGNSQRGLTRPAARRPPPTMPPARMPRHDRTIGTAKRPQRRRFVNRRPPGTARRFGRTAWVAPPGAGAFSWPGPSRPVGRSSLSSSAPIDAKALRRIRGDLAIVDGDEIREPFEVFFGRNTLGPSRRLSLGRTRTGIAAGAVRYWRPVRRRRNVPTPTAVRPRRPHRRAVGTTSCG